MKKIMLLILMLLPFLAPVTNAQDKKLTEENREAVPENINPEDVERVYQAYVNFVNSYLACNTREELMAFATENSEEISRMATDVSKYSAYFTPEQISGLEELSKKLMTKADILSKETSGNDAQSVADSITDADDTQEGIHDNGKPEATTSNEVNPEDVDKAYQAYVDFVNGYMACNSMEELTAYATQNMDNINQMSNDMGKYSSHFSPEQIATIQELSQKLSDKVTNILNSDSSEPANSDYSAQADSLSMEKYLDCFESEVNNRLLPSNLLLYLNTLYVETVMDSCADNVSGETAYMIARGFNEEQKIRLEKLTSLCKAKEQALIKEKNFDTSPDAVIDEINNVYNILASSENWRKQSRLYERYVETISKLLLDENGEASRLTDRQKDNFVTTILKFARKENELTLRQEGLSESFYFETLGDLLDIADNFYTSNMRNSDASSLNSEDLSYYEQLKYYLTTILHSDYIYIFINDKQKERLLKMVEDYPEIYY